MFVVRQKAIRQIWRSITCIPASAASNRGTLSPVIWSERRSFASAVNRAKYNIVEPHLKWEEENVRGYKVEQYYPAQIGEIFSDRYKSIGKLGYGSASTVWLCHDLQKEGEYVALKIYINCSKVHRELPIYRHINSLSSDAGGFHRVRKFLDSFEITGPDGKHICLVHEALGMNLEELRDLVPDCLFPPDFIRYSFRGIVRAIHFLHKEAGVIHTDIQPKNILFGITDNDAFKRFEQYEQEEPLPRKELSSRSIYTSRPMPPTKGVPSLSDLSEARFDGPQNDDLVMPDLYRAPEVILGLPWSFPIDKWGLAMTIWDLFEPKRLFDARGEDGRYSEKHHLAQMTAVLGPPPRELLEMSTKSDKFWDRDGHWKAATPIPGLTLESAEQRLEGEEKAHFLAFMRKMIQWKPEERSSIEDIFMDEWLLADLIESGEFVVDDSDEMK